MTSNDIGQKTVLVESVEIKHEDVHRVVNHFYHRVEVDPILSKPFSKVEDWPVHIKRLTHFWWVKFGGERYLLATYNPIEKHFLAGFNQAFLDHWLSLFKESLDYCLKPNQAEAWYQKAQRMGQFLEKKNQEMVERRSPNP